MQVSDVAAAGTDDRMGLLRERPPEEGDLLGSEHTAAAAPDYMCEMCWAVFRAGGQEACPVCKHLAPPGGWATLPYRFRGHYLFLRLLGRGGMGAVFLALDEQGRHGQDEAELLAIKVVQRVGGPSAHGKCIGRFAQEVAAAGFMGRSQYFVETKGYDVADPPYLAMRFVDWPTVSMLVEQAPLSPLQTSRLAMAILAGLSRLHSVGIVHRDIKPANLFYRRIDAEPGFEIKIADLGVWTREHGFGDGSSVAAVESSPVGTLDYMSPEQLACRPVDRRSDLHTLGSTLWLLATGQPAFPRGDADAHTDVEERRRRMRSQPERPPSMPQALFDVLVRAMAYSPCDRWDDAEAVRRALAVFEESASGASRSALDESLAPVRQTPSSPRDSEAQRPRLPTPLDAERDRQPLVMGDPESVPTLHTAKAPRLGLAVVVAVAAAAGGLLGGYTLGRDEKATQPPKPDGAQADHTRSASVAPHSSGVAHAELETAQSTFDSGTARAEPRQDLTGYVLIKPGVFWMGSRKDEPGADPDAPLHQVRITQAFYLKRTEVTQREWKEVMGSNPASHVACGDHCPVERVSWYDAVAYANRLSRREHLQECYELRDCNGRAGGGCPGARRLREWCGGDFICRDVEFRGLSCPGYRLPTEAEWEYAARAGTDTATYTGEIEVLGLHNSPSADRVAWYGGNSGVRYADAWDCAEWVEKQYPATRCGPQPVGQKLGNQWGLYDMLGNQWEWTWDRYGDYPSAPTSDPLGPGAGEHRVLRGGGWGSKASDIRAGQRGRFHPGERSGRTGFRLARSYLP